MLCICRYTHPESCVSQQRRRVKAADPDWDDALPPSRFYSVSRSSGWQRPPPLRSCCMPMIPHTLEHLIDCVRSSSPQGESRDNPSNEEYQMSFPSFRTSTILKQAKPLLQSPILASRVLRPLGSLPSATLFRPLSAPSAGRSMATTSLAQASTSDAVRSKSRIEKRPGPVESSMYLKVSVLCRRDRPRYSMPVRLSMRNVLTGN